MGLVFWWGMANRLIFGRSLGFLGCLKSPNMILSPLKVAGLIDNTKSWSNRILHDLFNVESVEAIKKIIIPLNPRLDKMVWILDPKGTFSVKSVIKANQDQVLEATDVCWKSLWKLHIHERYKILVWRIATGILPTKVNLALKLGHGDMVCPFCQESDETIEHLFFHCHCPSIMVW